MSNEEAKDIKHILADYHANHEVAHEKMMEEIRELKESIKKQGEEFAPVIEIYNDVKGTKKVFKFMFYTATLVIGFILSIKEVIKWKN